MDLKTSYKKWLTLSCDVNELTLLTMHGLDSDNQQQLSSFSSI